MAKTNAISLRDRIIEASKAPSPDREAFEIKHWDLTVYVAPMKVRDRMAMAKDPDRDTPQRLAAYSLVDEDGTQLFDATNPADLDIISSWDMALLEKLSEVVMRVSALTPKALDDIEKNSDAIL